MTKLDLSCPKCGGTRETTYVQYVEVNDYLKCTCTRCGHTFQKNAADYGADPVIPEGDTDVKD